jgi:AbrB family transcriptional regulator (stage V sporulation protein T)
MIKEGKMLKATGVVRRIDDLGRIVIPKEIRKTLRIKEGDPLEIFTDRDGQVILKKYSPIGELSEFATEYAETLAKTTGHIACITDKDTVIAVSGGSKKEFLEQGISKDLEKIMEYKEAYISKENKDISIPVTQKGNNDKINNSQVVYPIISDGDAIGTVILLSKDANTKMSEVENKVVQSAASFLGSQMEI